MNLIAAFAELFVGRMDAYGTEEGGCRRQPLADQNYWTYEHEVEAHLRGLVPMGVYPVRQVVEPDVPWREADAAHIVHWGCVDFDEGEEASWAHATNVHAYLEGFGVAAYIERSRSKGYHVWVFADEWTEAWIMRQALLGACQAMDAPQKEINPKQDELGDGQLGNYVRLPYPGGLPTMYESTTDRRVVVSAQSGLPITLSRFVSRAYASRVGQDGLKRLAAAYKPPERPIARRQWSELRGEARDRLAGKAAIIFNEGPIVPGEERGHTLWKLARYLREDDRHSFEEALTLLQDADARWGKFTERGDEQYLEQMLQQAWVLGKVT